MPGGDGPAAAQRCPVPHGAVSGALEAARAAACARPAGPRGPELAGAETPFTKPERTAVTRRSAVGVVLGAPSRRRRAAAGGSRGPGRVR